MQSFFLISAVVKICVASYPQTVLFAESLGTRLVNVLFPVNSLPTLNQLYRRFNTRHYTLLSGFCFFKLVSKGLM